MKPLIALAQAGWLLLSRPRLQEPTGPRAGVIGSGPPLRLLILGDSAAAGVGVDTQADALAGQLPRALSPHYTVDWRLAARCGATTQTTLARLHALPADPFDAVLLALGINDAKNGVPLDRFAATYIDILNTLRRRHGTRLILSTALPPVHRFTTVPEPLRSQIGSRAQRFDARLAELAQANGARRLSLDLPPERRYLGADGLHPSAATYAIWADIAATMIKENIR